MHAFVSFPLNYFAYRIILAKRREADSFFFFCQYGQCGDSVQLGLRLFFGFSSRIMTVLRIRNVDAHCDHCEKHHFCDMKHAFHSNLKKTQVVFYAADEKRNLFKL